MEVASFLGGKPQGSCQMLAKALKTNRWPLLMECRMEMASLLGDRPQGSCQKMAKALVASI